MTRWGGLSWAGLRGYVLTVCIAEPGRKRSLCRLGRLEGAGWISRYVRNDEGTVAVIDEGCGDRMDYEQ